MCVEPAHASNDDILSATSEPVLRAGTLNSALHAHRKRTLIQWLAMNRGKHLEKFKGEGD